jgi:prepilin-type N-terminal cleavage/methylation domain-containing protein/prepilin-type processing-associated H-X9-DG protein
MSLPSTVRPRGRAFTLVELLVVIGIIALLISVLLPALTEARRQAAAVKCLSAMRQIGAFYQLYAFDNKQMLPVIRQDLPEINGVPTNSSNVYWTDLLMKYATKSGKGGYFVDATTEAGRRAFDEFKRSVLWGCPAWDGWKGAQAGGFGTYVGDTSRFENGYAQNTWPGIQPSDPATVLPPARYMNVRSTAMTGDTTGGTVWKLPKITKSAERLALVDANLWIDLITATDANFTLAPQNAVRTVKAGLGATHIDRYRHGKYPAKTIIDTGQLSFHPNDGKVKFNVLYYDGHAATLTDYKQGWAAIWMRYPQP